MNRTIFYSKILSLILFLILFCPSCRAGNHEGDKKSGKRDPRTIAFSGYEWDVTDSGSEIISPGGNFFSSSPKNVRVDRRGRLHLRIIRRKGNWYCANIALKESFAHDRYIFYVSSRVDRLDRNVVAGLFAYKDDLNEIDIEFSRWGMEKFTNGQFTVQPAHGGGNLQRFNLNLKSKHSTHIIDWKEDRIDFASYRGHTATRSDDDNIIREWTYSGDNIPEEDDERIMINLWLYNGVPPANNKGARIIIEAFEIQ